MNPRTRKGALYTIGVIAILASVNALAHSYAELYDWAIHHRLSGWQAKSWPAEIDVFLAVGELPLYVAYLEGWPARQRIWPWTTALTAWPSASPGTSAIYKPTPATPSSPPTGSPPPPGPQRRTRHRREKRPLPRLRPSRHHARRDRHLPRSPCMRRTTQPARPGTATTRPRAPVRQRPTPRRIGASRLCGRRSGGHAQMTQFRERCSCRAVISPTHPTRWRYVTAIQLDGRRMTPPAAVFAAWVADHGPLRVSLP
jgi:hypothetical protein